MILLAQLFFSVLISEYISMIMNAPLEWSSRDIYGRNISCYGERVVLNCTVNSPLHKWIIQSDTGPDIIEILSQSDTRQRRYPLHTINRRYSFNIYRVYDADYIHSSITFVSSVLMGTTIFIVCEDLTGRVPSQSERIKLRSLFRRWMFVIGLPGDLHQLSELHVEIEMGSEDRQCVNSFTVIDREDRSMRCTGDRNTTTMKCLTGNFCHRTRYMLYGSANVGPPERSIFAYRNYTVAVPTESSDYYICSPSPSYRYERGYLVIDVSWQVIDELIMTGNNMEGTFSLPGISPSEVILFTNGARAKYNVSETFFRPGQSSLSASFLLNFKTGTCSSTKGVSLTVWNTILVTQQDQNALSIHFRPFLYYDEEPGSVSIHQDCPSMSIPEATASYAYGGGKELTALVESARLGCSFTVKLLSVTNQSIGFPVVYQSISKYIRLDLQQQEIATISSPTTFTASSSTSSSFPTTSTVFSMTVPSIIHAEPSISFATATKPTGRDQIMTATPSTTPVEPSLSTGSSMTLATGIKATGLSMTRPSMTLTRPSMTLGTKPLTFATNLPIILAVKPSITLVSASTTNVETPSEIPIPTFGFEAPVLSRVDTIPNTSVLAILVGVTSLIATLVGFCIAATLTYCIGSKKIFKLVKKTCCSKKLCKHKKQTCKKRTHKKRTHKKSTHKKNNKKSTCEKPTHEKSKSTHEKPTRTHEKSKSTHEKPTHEKSKSTHEKPTRTHEKSKSTHEKPTHEKSKSTHEKPTRTHEKLKSTHEKSTHEKPTRIHEKSTHEKPTRTHEKSTHEKPTQTHEKLTHEKPTRTHEKSTHEKPTREKPTHEKSKSTPEKPTRTHEKSKSTHEKQKPTQTHEKSTHEKPTQTHEKSTHEKPTRTHKKSTHEKDTRTHEKNL